MKKPSLNTRKYWIVAAGLLAIVLLVFLCTSLSSGPAADPDPTGPNAAQDKLQLLDLLGTAKAIKGNLLSALEDIKQNDLTSAREKVNAVQKDIDSVQVFIGTTPLLMDLIPQSETITELINAADMAIPEILLPAIDLLESRPFSALRAGDGFDVTLLCDYIDFAESVIPKLESLLETVNSVDLSFLDSEGKLTEPLELANNLLDIYHENPTILPMLKRMLGAEEDRIYLIAVQNSSEIRASGGFPGAMGLLQIENGILTIGDFESVVKFLAMYTPSNIQITQEEHVLFNYLSTMKNPRDADLCPDFERVGHIWASSYEGWHRKNVAGIISVTPHIVQRLLAATGMEIELFDGLVLTGDNATKVLIHDIYFKYFDRNNPHPDRLIISDQLFADAAKKTLEKLTDDISVSRILSYLSVAKDCIDDRTLMLWMKDENEQAFIREMGWSGGLNQDPQNPEAGIYVNVVSASKMGWFLLMDTEIGERTVNADGSCTYPITVTFSNNVTAEEIKAADSYISAGLGGSMWTVAYFFAPAGGSVDNFTASNGQKISLKTYNGMTLGFTDHFVLKPDAVITVTYTVTTAPGVDTPLAISKTPIAQQP